MADAITTSSEEANTADFDPNALRDRYRAERDKRIRKDGNEQYIEIKDSFAHYIEDPYIDEEITREPLSDEVEVVVVGGGFGGLLAGVRLKEAGVENVRLIEKGGDFGGTWYWNRYPGAACDVESYIYLPLLEETGFIPKEKYTHAPEILKHSRNIAEQFGLYDNALLQTEVTGMRWNEDLRRWIVETNRGDKIKARFVINCSGPLHRPKLPGLEGISDFKGHSFHTSRWDYDYTGGGPDGDLNKLKDKRVGIIGTGATAVQCIPHLAKGAGELYVFQRTPSSVDVRDNTPTDPEWAKSLKPGWQKERMHNFNSLVSGGFEAEDLVKDGWTDIIRNILLKAQTGQLGDVSPDKIPEIMEIADFEKMNGIRSRVDSIVQDPQTASALKPWYRQFCKRPCFHEDYLPSFNRENVTLVDTNGQGVDRIDEKGVVANGELYELDCLIYATGFEVGTEYSRRAGYEIVGENGVSVTDKWADGVRTLHGLYMNGFPNCFMVTPAQGGFAVNFVHMLDDQMQHISYIVSEVLNRQSTRFEVTKEAEDQWVQTIIDMSRFNESFLENCTPGYYNNEGKPSELARQNSSYGAGPVAFVQLLEAWRAKGELDGLALD